MGMALGNAAHVSIFNHQVIIYHKITSPSVSTDKACPRTTFNHSTEIESIWIKLLGLSLEQNSNVLPELEDLMSSRLKVSAILSHLLAWRLILQFILTTSGMKTLKRSIIDSIHLFFIHPVI